MAYTFSHHAHNLALSAVLVTAVSFAGCGKQEAPKTSETTATEQAGDSHDHSQHGAPESFAEGVAELKEHYAEIKVAFAESDSAKAVDMAHEPLHGIGLILEALPKLATKDSLSTEDSQAVEEAVDTMFQCYGNIDGAVHDGKTPDYQAEADKLDEAMAAIEAVLGQSKQ